MFFDAEWWARAHDLPYGVDVPPSELAEPRMVWKLADNVDAAAAEAIARPCEVVYCPRGTSIAALLSRHPRAFVYRSQLLPDAAMRHHCEEAEREVRWRPGLDAANPYLSGLYEHRAGCNNAPTANRVVDASAREGAHGLRLMRCAHTDALQVQCSRGALAVMDFHGHLCHEEVIGFLGGHVDGATVHVQRAFPCASTPSADDRVQVEADPLAQLTVFERIHELGLTVVGWYHSHPSFEPSPSVRDALNQLNLQGQFGARFVGAIVATMDARLPYGVSAFNWFVAREDNGALEGCTPLSLACTALDGSLDPQAAAGAHEALGCTSHRQPIRSLTPIKCGSVWDARVFVSWFASGSLSRTIIPIPTRSGPRAPTRGVSLRSRQCGSCAPRCPSTPPRS